MAIREYNFYDSNVEIQFSVLLCVEVQWTHRIVFLFYRYKQRAKETSAIYHDRPVSPGQELVHWVEHVVKTGGAPHLRSPSFLMPWWKKLFVDVIVIVSSVIFVIFIVIKKIFTLGSKKTDSKKKN